MKQEEFIKLIKSLGFEGKNQVYSYDRYVINIWDEDSYYFWNGSKWVDEISINDLTPELSKMLRSYKLKQLLE